MNFAANYEEQNTAKEFITGFKNKFRLVSAVKRRQSNYKIDSRESIVELQGSNAIPNKREDMR